MPPGPPPGFSKNVFINCPFDSEYDSLLRPILFTILYLGHNPQIASQTSDSGEQRINKILSLILKSKFSIHDLSRLKSAKSGEFFRLNMPFELGIDYACRRIGNEHLRRKIPGVGSNISRLQEGPIRSWRSRRQVACKQSQQSCSRCSQLVC
jgi:hypothetical protein